MKSNESIKTGESDAPLISFARFCAQLGVGSITGWRWRKRGWITAINIAGRQYVSREAIAEFKRRAEAGEFSKEHRVPRRAAAELAA